MVQYLVLYSIMVEGCWGWKWQAGGRPGGRAEGRFMKGVKEDVKRGNSSLGSLSKMFRDRNWFCSEMVNVCCGNSPLIPLYKGLQNACVICSSDREYFWFLTVGKG